MPFKLVMLPPQTDVYRGWGDALAREIPDIAVVVAESGAQAGHEIADADGAVGVLPKDLLAKAGRLRWLQSHQAAPPAGYYYPELIAHPLQVTNMREIFNDHIGAHIMAYVLAFARGLHYYLPHQLRGEWAPRPLDQGVLHLAATTALIVGAGGIGAETARLASAFGITVIATDARRTDRPPGVAELHPADALDALLPRADFVILTVPHTPATEGFMNAARFGRMKRGAFFINIGRGKTTRLDDLTAALRGGRDRRRGPRRVRGGAAAGRPSALDHAERADHAAHRGLRPAPRRTPLPDPARQLPRHDDRRQAAQCRRQGQLVLTRQHMFASD